MRTRKRLTKQQLKRDRFVDTTFDWALWARENARTVAIAGVGIVIVALALVLYRTSEARESRQAAQKFQDVMQVYNSGNFQLAANDLKQFITQYGNTPLADEARIHLGNAYLLAGDPSSAARTLEEARGGLDESPLAYSAASLLGAAYESAGDTARAVEAYGSAAREAQYDFQRAAALMDQARIYAQEGSREKAASAYREILEKYPQSTVAEETRVRLAELTAEPLAGAPTVPVEAAAADTGAAPGADVSGATPDSLAAADSPTGEPAALEPAAADSGTVSEDVSSGTH